MNIKAQMPTALVAKIKPQSKVTQMPGQEETLMSLCGFFQHT